MRWLISKVAIENASDRVRHKQGKGVSDVLILNIALQICSSKNTQVFEFTIVHDAFLRTKTSRHVVS